MVLSALPAASVPPLALNAIELTCWAGPDSVASSDGRAGVRTLHIQTVPSVTPVASVRESGLNATDDTYPFGPVSGLPRRRGRPGADTSHSRTVWFAPIASVRPSG